MYSLLSIFIYFATVLYLQITAFKKTRVKYRLLANWLHLFIYLFLKSFSINAYVEYQLQNSSI